MHDRRLEPLGERNQLRVRALAAAAAQQRHPAAGIEQRREPVEIAARRCHYRGRWQQALYLCRRRLDRALQRDVAWYDDDRHTALADRLADRNLDDARHLVGAGCELAIMAAFREERLRVRFLEISGADLGRRDLRGNGQNRHP